MVPLKSAASAETKDLRIRATLLLHMFRQKQNDIPVIVLPTVAIAELLVPVPNSQRGELISTLSKRFVCQPFDLRASAIASDLWARHKSLPPDLQYESRHVLKSDAMILASAKAAGAVRFYTSDRKCRALADICMSGCDLPKRDPDDMFAAGDAERGEL